MASCSDNAPLGKSVSDFWRTRKLAVDQAFVEPCARVNKLPENTLNRFNIQKYRNNTKNSPEIHDNIWRLIGPLTFIIRSIKMHRRTRNNFRIYSFNCLKLNYNCLAKLVYFIKNSLDYTFVTCHVKSITICLLSEILNGCWYSNKHSIMSYDKLTINPAH